MNQTKGGAENHFLIYHLINMKPKKSLGQNFLTSEGAVESILDAGDVMGEDIILEIGPGKGTLTKKLLEFGGKVLAIEKDDKLYLNLKEKFKKEIKNKKLELIHGDALDFNPKDFKLNKNGYKLIANIPYNITGQIIRKFLESEIQPERMVLMVQKEVAQRIVAKDKKESILSVSVKAYGEPKYIQTVKAGSFFPIPNVDSAILLIDNISKNFFKDFSEVEFFKLVRAGFASKRKKLSSNLSVIVDKEKVRNVFKELNLGDNSRAEDVDINIWQQLSIKIIKG